MIGERNCLHTSHVIGDCRNFQKGKKKKNNPFRHLPNLTDISYVRIILFMIHDLILECAAVWRGKSICQACVLRVEFMFHKEIHFNNLVMLWCLQFLLLFCQLQASNCTLKCIFPTVLFKYSLSVLYKMILKTN